MKAAGEVSWDPHHQLTRPAVAGNQPSDTTYLAHVSVVLVTGDHEPLLNEQGGAVPDQAVSLHLTHSQTAVLGTTLSGLPSQQRTRASASANDRGRSCGGDMPSTQ